MIEEVKKKIENCGHSWYCEETFNNLLEEIERLNKECDTYMKIATNKGKENKRLNNIINELEKALDENVELTYVHNGKRQYNKTLTEGGLLFRDYIKSKLQELKGSDTRE